MLPLGTKGPDFTLQGTAGQFHLAEHQGKSNVVIIFYPKDNTSG